MRYATTSNIDTILERESGFTLEELLEEDELLQECKSQNTKLLELCARRLQQARSVRRPCADPPHAPRHRSLCEPDQLRKMIDYIVLMPNEEDPEARRYKYPYVSSEVLSCDLTVLRSSILQLSEPFVEQVLSILLQPPPLAPVLAGYCAKVIVSLYKSQPEQFMQFFTEHWDSNPTSPIRCARRCLPHHRGPHAGARSLGPAPRGPAASRVEGEGGG